ncbi:nucleotide-sugar transporter-domain-containing protein [Naematelia encephala]|uniref:Nucleotide-sugar transporter-domain-containing protein n=1 Tax=Naematelia encephala TaxID=71784 RepID=A0A1Y2BEE9_9TREE|nr:nucleotide-sugar transporter-domain-containing protein [Naematelia encephala]
MHYSRITTAPSKTYSAASAVLLNELLKGIISVIVALRHIDQEMSQATPSYVSPLSEKETKILHQIPSPSFTSWFQASRLRNLSNQVLSPDCYKLAVPAILYVIQNNLQYVAATNLDVATFQVTYQMKILTTAFFSVLLLRKRLTKAKWASLVMLAIGVGIVQLQSTTAPAAQAHSASPPHNHGIIQKGSAQLRSDIPVAPSDSDAPLVSSERVMHPFRGFLAVTLACMTSGLAGVYFEFILKSSSGSSTPPPDLWVRNTQLSLFSLVPALIPVLFGGQAGVGFVERMMASFANFNGWAIGTVLTQTLGGLITAIVIRYSDNIMKGFATSLSIIISFLASVALFSYPITFAFLLGSSIVLAATYLYNAPSSPSTPPTRTTVAVAPGSPITTSAPILGEPERPSRTNSVISLLGLGGSTSQAASRRPSASDLRGMNGPSANFSFGFTPTPTMGLGGGGWTGHSASAPGTPYPSSTSTYPTSSAMGVGNPYDTTNPNSSHSGSNPNSGTTSPMLNLNSNVGIGAPPRRASPGLSTASGGSGSDKPKLSLDIQK